MPKRPNTRTATIGSPSPLPDEPPPKPPPPPASAAAEPGAAGPGLSENQR